SFLMTRPPPQPTLFPYTTLFRSHRQAFTIDGLDHVFDGAERVPTLLFVHDGDEHDRDLGETRISLERREHRPAVHVRHHDVEGRSEEHTSELQSRGHLVCRLLLE